MLCWVYTQFGKKQLEECFNTSESPEPSLRLPNIIFQNNSEISRIIFVIGREEGLSLHKDTQGPLKPGVERLYMNGFFIFMSSI